MTEMTISLWAAVFFALALAFFIIGLLEFMAGDMEAYRYNFVMCMLIIIAGGIFLK